MKNIEFRNAGAGSGKTHELVNILATSLREGACTPGQVILTTFTDLAAAEFREKAREALLKAELYHEASMLDTAAIGTVHSVAYSFVRKYWYLLGRSAENNVISNEDRQFFIDQSLAGIASCDDIAFFEKLLKEFCFSRSDDTYSKEDPEYWKTHLRCIIEKIVQYDITNLHESNINSKKLLDSIFISNDDFNENSAREMLKVYVTICGDAKRKKCAENLIRSVPFRYSDILDLAMLAPCQAEKNNIANLDSIISAAEHALQSKKFGDMLRDYSDRIFGLAKAWLDSYNDYKAKNRLIDYNDMESLFLELLGKDEVAGEIRSSYKLVLVDEFQDSSPVQVKIFDRLSELVERSIWVGDPKQAIYGFRGSDALLISNIASLFNKGDKERNLRNGTPLDNSYRSRAGLVSLANKVFTRTFNEIDRALVELNPKRNDKTEFGANQGNHLLHWHFEKTDRQANDNEHYSCLAQQVIRLLREGKIIYDKHEKKARPVKPEDIAILCRTNRHVNKIAEILKGLGVKTTGQNAESTFTETAEISLLLAVMNYILDPRNDLAKAEILHLCDDMEVNGIISSRLKFMPLVDEARKKKEAGEEKVYWPVWQNNNEFLKMTAMMVKGLSSLPVPSLVDALITRLDLMNVVSRWGNTHRRRNNLELLRKYAMAYDERCIQMGNGASLNDFIVYISALTAPEIKVEKLKGAVNVLTYHKAKGLEWNIVILEELDYDELNPDELIRKSFFGVSDIAVSKEGSLYPERSLLLLPWFNGAKKKIQEHIKNIILSTPEYEYLQKKTLEEVKRLMYVGATRARDYMITTSYANKELKWLANIGCLPVTPGSMDLKVSTIDIWNAGEGSDLTVTRRDTDFRGIEEDWNERIVLKDPSIEKFNSRYLNPSKMEDNREASVGVLHQSGKRIAVVSNGSVSDAQVGDCIHEIFCVHKPWSGTNTDSARIILQNKLMESVFPKPEDITASADNLCSFLRNTYGDPTRIFRELPVQLLMGGQVVRGTCDMLWDTEAGAVLVDYKSYQGGIREITLEGGPHYAGIYAPQLRAYRNVLEKSGKKIISTLIYYAVSGIIAEVN